MSSLVLIPELAQHNHTTNTSKNESNQKVTCTMAQSSTPLMVRLCNDLNREMRWQWMGWMDKKTALVNAGQEMEILIPKLQTAPLSVWFMTNFWWIIWSLGWRVQVCHKSSNCRWFAPILPRRNNPAITLTEHCHDFLPCISSLTFTKQHAHVHTCRNHIGHHMSETHSDSVSL